MAKKKKSPARKKVAHAKKPAKKAKPVKAKAKPVKAKAKPAKAKAKAKPVKKAKKAPSKRVSPPKKAAPKAVAKKAQPKRAASKPAAKGKVSQKSSRLEKTTGKGLQASGSQKSSTAHIGAVKAQPRAPIKVEPRIIETPEQERVAREVSDDIFEKAELEKFRVILTDEKQKILDKARHAVEAGNIYLDKDEMYDEVDQASAMVEQNLNLRLLDRDRKLLGEIEHALGKIDTGDFGYCEGTGEPIPKRRLELRPWCRHSVKYKEKLERMKKSGRGVVDEDEI
jgi:DnaK suppressor protein